MHRMENFQTTTFQMSLEKPQHSVEARVNYFPISLQRDGLQHPSDVERREQGLLHHCAEYQES